VLHLGVPAGAAATVAILVSPGSPASAGLPLTLLVAVWLGLHLGGVLDSARPRRAPRRRADLSDQLRVNLARPNTAPQVDMLSTLWR